MMLTENKDLNSTFILVLFSFIKASKITSDKKPVKSVNHLIGKVKEKCQNQKITFLKVCFLDYWRQEGKGRVGQGFDVYLLDNRNRTQKWDE